MRYAQLVIGPAGSGKVRCSLHDSTWFFRAKFKLVHVRTSARVRILLVGSNPLEIEVLVTVVCSQRTARMFSSTAKASEELSI